MRFEVKWNKLKPSTAINDRIIVFEYQPMSAYLDTAIDDRIIVFEYQPMSVKRTRLLLRSMTALSFSNISLCSHILSTHGHHLSPLLTINNHREVLPGHSEDSVSDQRSLLFLGLLRLRKEHFLHFLVEEYPRMAAMQRLINHGRHMIS